MCLLKALLASKCTVGFRDVLKGLVHVNDGMHANAASRAQCVIPRASSRYAAPDALGASRDLGDSDSERFPISRARYCAFTLWSILPHPTSTCLC